LTKKTEGRPISSRRGLASFSEGAAAIGNRSVSVGNPSPLSLFPSAQSLGLFSSQKGRWGMSCNLRREHLNTYNEAVQTKTGATSLWDAFTVPTDRTSRRLADFADAYFQQSKFPSQHTRGFLERSILSLLKDQEQFEVMEGMDQEAIQEQIG